MKEMLRNNYGALCCGLRERTCDNMLPLESQSPDSMSFDRINNSLGHGIDNLASDAYPVTEWQET